MCYSWDSKHQGCREIFGDLWLFASFLEIGLHTLGKSSALELHISIHKHKGPSTSKRPSDGAIKNLKKCQPGKRLQKELIGWCCFVAKNASNGETKQPGGLEGTVVAFRHPLEIRQSVWTQREKQWNVDDVTEHPEESSKGKASYCLDPKSTLILAWIPSAARNLTLTEWSVLIIRAQCWREGVCVCVCVIWFLIWELEHQHSPTHVVGSLWFQCN